VGASDTALRLIGTNPRVTIWDHFRVADHNGDTSGSFPFDPAASSAMTFQEAQL
jgi:hypothetical protein